jgi:AAA family ATPase
MKRVGTSAKKGILMYGPPGCSKTLSAQAMATEIGFNFFAVKGAELLNMYVGESERQVREIFARARAASPSIIFFDEIESIGSKREGGRSNGVNVLTTLLNEMDGIETLKGVMVLAATNKPQALDLALLRPGRFDKLLYVAPPDMTGREEILRIRTKKMDISTDVDIAELARLTEGYSGAELVSVCSEACDLVIRKCRETGLDLQVHMGDLLGATKVVKKQITPELVKGYEKWAAGVRGDTDYTD